MEDPMQVDPCPAASTKPAAVNPFAALNDVLPSILSLFEPSEAELLSTVCKQWLCAHRKVASASMTFSRESGFVAWPRLTFERRQQQQTGDSSSSSSSCVDYVACRETTRAVEQLFIHVPMRRTLRGASRISPFLLSQRALAICPRSPTPTLRVAKKLKFFTLDDVRDYPVEITADDLNAYLADVTEISPDCIVCIRTNRPMQLAYLSGFTVLRKSRVMSISFQDGFASLLAEDDALRCPIQHVEDLTINLDDDWPTHNGNLELWRRTISAFTGLKYLTIIRRDTDFGTSLLSPKGQYPDTVARAFWDALRAVSLTVEIRVISRCGTYPPSYPCARAIRPLSASPPSELSPNPWTPEEAAAALVRCARGSRARLSAESLEDERTTFRDAHSDHSSAQSVAALSRIAWKKDAHHVNAHVTDAILLCMLYLNRAAMRDSLLVAQCLRGVCHSLQHPSLPNSDLSTLRRLYRYVIETYLLDTEAHKTVSLEAYFANAPLTIGGANICVLELWETLLDKPVGRLLARNGDGDWVRDSIVAYTYIALGRKVFAIRRSRLPRPAGHDSFEGLAREEVNVILSCVGYDGMARIIHETTATSDSDDYTRGNMLSFLEEFSRPGAMDAIVYDLNSLDSAAS